MKYYLYFTLVFGLLLASCADEPPERDNPAPDPILNEPAVAEGDTIAVTPHNVEVSIYTPGGNMQVMQFSEDEIEAYQGMQVKVKLINNAPAGSALEHNIVFVQESMAGDIASKALKAGAANSYVPVGHEGVIAASETIGPGKETELTFTAPAKGSYLFICTYPGHYPAMQGRFEVL